MRAVIVSIDVPQEPEPVYEFLDVMANHELFTDHYLTHWRGEGPGRGVGSRATVTAALGGAKAEVGIEVIDAERPWRIVEENTSAGGRRLARGTYRIEPLPTGGSRVSFEYAWLRAPLADRLLAPLVRATIRRANTVAMRRLAAELARGGSPATP
ncbi:SRPBCC family protein [Streptomyces hoynatensis]|uniref:SRPBCC family protein n=1 Tax=Streptomyces hoynatensis TaxID=1141874 RepID=A0A3A9Z5I5_9ACTN|nr:SRPBCC family protein [Streptomyces hoynatensis]RKN43772.1 SRPBCC family protein [Streptomyces hoynatensis]